MIVFQRLEGLQHAKVVHNVFARKHSDDAVPVHDRKLVYAIAAHLLESGPQHGVGLCRVQLLRTETMICAAIVVGHAWRGTSCMAARVTIPVVPPALRHDDIAGFGRQRCSIDELLQRDFGGNMREVAPHRIGHFVAAEQVLQSLLLQLASGGALQEPANEGNPDSSEQVPGDRLPNADKDEQKAEEAARRRRRSTVAR